MELTETDFVKAAKVAQSKGADLPSIVTMLEILGCHHEDAVEIAIDAVDDD